MAQTDLSDYRQEQTPGVSGTVILLRAVAIVIWLGSALFALEGFAAYSSSERATNFTVALELLAFGTLLFGIAMGCRHLQLIEWKLG